MKTSDWIITYLRDIGLKHIFVVYGAANGDLIDAFTRIEGIKYVAVMHEQAGAFMAETYAKVTGKLACMIVTSGPGGHNLITGIANCFYDSTPVLFITGQINTQFIKTNDAVRQVGFQETDIVGITKPITKLSYQVKKTDKVNLVVGNAVRLALADRQGPVLLDIPVDVQKQEVSNEN